MSFLQFCHGRALSIIAGVSIACGIFVTVSSGAPGYPVEDPGDGYWDPRFNLPPGVNGAVSCAVTMGRDLFIGGRFTIAGDSAARGLARWDGKTWSAVGEGLEGHVNTLRVSGKSLYVGGRFRTLGSVAVTNIAKWTSRRGWESLGLGIGWMSPGNSDQFVSAIAIRGRQIVVGGSFNEAGGIAATNIAVWNTKAWAPLDGGIGYSSSFWRVESLVWVGRSLYAGGVFDRAGNVAATNIACWDGKQWSSLEGGLVGGHTLVDVGGTTHSGVVSSLARSGKSILASGDFTLAGSVQATNLARWSRGKWTSVGGGVQGSGAWTVLAKGAAVYVGGSFEQAGGVGVTNIARWNGRRWEGLDARLHGSVNALALRGRNLYVGGYFGLAGDTGAAFIAQHSSMKWTALQSGADAEPFGTNAIIGRVNAIAASGNDVYVAGQIFSAGLTPVNNIARWDGDQWHALGGGIPDGVISHLAIEGTNLYAAGSFIVPEIGATNLARWNGQRWSALAEGVSISHPVLGNSSDVYISALAASRGKLYVAGTFNRAGFLEANGIACWDGYGWLPEVPGFVPISESSPFSLFSVLTADAQGFYAAGSFTSIGGVNATNVARWDGFAWRALTGNAGPSFPTNASFSAARTMAVMGTNLFVSGDGGSGTSEAASLLRWDGAGWHSPGLSSSGGASIFSIAATTRLYVAGIFDDLGGVPVRNIARWSGSNWTNLRGGIGSAGTPSIGDVDRVESIQAGSESLYVGGLFGEVDGRRAFNFAVWREVGLAPSQPFP